MKSLTDLKLKYNVHSCTSFFFFWFGGGGGGGGVGGGRRGECMMKYELFSLHGIPNVQPSMSYDMDGGTIGPYIWLFF